MNRDEEDFDGQGLKKAVLALRSLDKIIVIQQAARETVNAEISVCYSKLQGYEHNIYFVIHSRSDVTFESSARLSAKLSELLSYDEVLVYKDSSLSQAPFNSDYSSFVLISPENIAELRKFVTEYTHYIGEDSFKLDSSIYDEFFELLKESDSTEQEKLLRRLAEDCESLGIDIDVQAKRSRLEKM